MFHNQTKIILYETIDLQASGLFKLGPVKVTIVQDSKPQECLLSILYVIIWDSIDKST